MPGTNIFQRQRLPYKRLPDEASSAIYQNLTHFGFDKKAIVEGYSFSSKKDLVRVNALAFAHPSQRDLDDYASFTVYNAVNGHDDESLVYLLAESSAPFHIIHRENKFAFWGSGVEIDTQRRKNANIQPKPIPIAQDIAYEQLGDVLEIYAADLKPERIVEVKRGREVFKHFPAFNPLQLSLWAEEIRSKPLVKYFEHAIHILRGYKVQLSEDEVTLIATQLLGLLILADTGALGDEINREELTLPVLIERAHTRFPNYFESNLLLKTYREVVEQAYDILQRIQYAGFVPDMLGDLYAVAYEPDIRKKLGNYDTPLYLTRRILDTIPIEYLPPDERTITDYTCGWGSFLLAGQERLSKLSDAREMRIQQCIYGNDYDTFFTQLAKIGLMHTTGRDDWHLDNQNIFEWQGPGGKQPNIIIGNPPFAGNRKKTASVELSTESDIQENQSEQRRIEKANAFLEHAIEQLKPGGYLAIIMPRSFTIAEAGPSTRKKLLEECEIIELWDLPSQVFKGVTVRTMVIFAQKKKVERDGQFHNCIRVRTVQPSTLKNFESTGMYTASALVADQSTWKAKEWKNEPERTTSYVLDYKAILSESSWEAIKEHCTDLLNCAERTRGITRGTERPYLQYPSKLIHLLPDVKHVMPHSYKLNYSKAKELLYPRDCERPRMKDEWLFRGKKILLQYIQTPSWGNRVKLAIEREGFYASEHFYVIVPKACIWLSYTMTEEILAAILGWEVSNAWIIEHMKSPAIPSQAIDTLPIPSKLTDYECNALTQAIKILEREAEVENFTSNFRSLAAIHAQDEIDTILKAAYHLDEETFQRLRQVKEWEEKPNTTVDVQPNLSRTNWLTSGVVNAVDARSGTITFWIDGFDKLQTLGIVPSMPGWLLRPGAAFLTKFPREYRRLRIIEQNTVDWSYFRPQPYMYLDEEELLTKISNHFVVKAQ
jgi:N-6 DNA methylase